jgi:hypothetical protein
MLLSSPDHNEQPRWTSPSAPLYPPGRRAPDSARRSARLPTDVAIQRTGIVPALPDMPRRVVECVPVGGKPAVRLLQRACQYIGLPWNGHKVDMVRHQAVADESYPILFRALP